ncbi:MAG: FG-GAP-like repeat-containing protein [Acidimicrobiales bacterium]
MCDTGALNTQGDPQCTLRAAIEEANASAGIDTIHFDIPTSEAGYVGGSPAYWVIGQASNYPDIVGVDIDATTQPGYVDPVVVVDGTATGGGGGIGIDATDSRIAGLSIVNALNGVAMYSGGSHTIEATWVGVLPDGSAAGNGAAGITITSGSASVDNVVSSNNATVGVHFDAGATGTVTNSFIGTDPTGTVAMGNDTGVLVSGATGVVIGGSGSGNTIAANTLTAVSVDGGATGTVVQGNQLGKTGLGNGFNGVILATATETILGGTAAGQGNTITANVLDAVYVTGGSHSIVGNTIFGNGGLAIDIGGGIEDGNGVTANDANDVDSGPNDLLNRPVITAAAESGGNVTVDFDLDVPAGDYRIELFTNPSGADSSGYGEGEQFETATTVTHTGSGSESFQLVYPGLVGDLVSLTATEESAGPTYRSTSEFSATFTATAAACTDSDADGLCDNEEDANTDLDNDASTNPGPDTDGDTVPDYMDPDDDGDGLPTASESADPNADGDPRDALDSDWNGTPDYLDAPSMPTYGLVSADQIVADAEGGLAATFDNGDAFGNSVAVIGDIDGDGTDDYVVGANSDDDGGPNRGAVYILFMNPDGTVKAEQKISSTTGGFVGPLDDNDDFGSSVAGVGDIDGDGVNDIAVGALADDDGGSGVGAVYVLFLNPDGTVKDEQKISATSGGIAGPLDPADRFGFSAAGIGDHDGDGVNDLAVGAVFDSDGAGFAGAVYILFLNPDGTVKDEQKISATSGGFTGPLSSSDYFGSAVTALGDVDLDGITDIAVGSYGADDGASAAGGLYVLMLNGDGTVKSEQKISSVAGGLATALEGADYFGIGAAGLGDLDGDGVPDLAVGAMGDDDGGADRGAVYVLSLNPDGTVKHRTKISASEGGLATPIDDGAQFGVALASTGDLDGDGTIGFVAGARYDEGSGSNRGAIYTVDLTLALPVNSSGDATDLAAGDGACDTGALNSEGDPECTLRAAVEEANALAGTQAVTFGIPTSDPGYTPVPGYWTISPTSALPAVAGDVIVDAATQAGHTPNTATAPAALNGTHTIEIDGSAAGPVAGLTLTGTNTTVRGLTIGGFAGAAVLASPTATGAVIADVWSGTTIDGTGVNANGTGLRIEGAGVQVGGATPGDRSVFSANSGNGVELVGATAAGVVIEGSMIGLAVDGLAALGNGDDGVSIASGAQGTTIGGASADLTNIISGNAGAGIRLNSSGNANTVRNNLIGVDSTGLTASRTTRVCESRTPAPSAPSSRTRSRVTPPRDWSLPTRAVTSTSSTRTASASVPTD